MIEVVLAFLAGWLLNWYALIGLCVFGIVAEHNDGRGFAVFAALVAATVSFFFFNLTIADLLMFGLAYLAVGFGWSFWRYRRYVVAEVERINNSNIKNDHGQRDHAIDKLKPRNHTDTIIAWVIIWPFSAIENLVGDLITGLQTLVTKTFKAVYNNIYESAIKDIK